MKVALVRCLNTPQEDADAPPLVAAFEARGHAAAVVSWDDTAVDWSRFDAVLLRSTWNYFHDLERFLTWARQVDAVTHLWNPIDIVRWNAHKFYLRDLEERRIGIIPTVFLPARTTARLESLLVERGWESAVLKPAVSADSFATLRAERASPASLAAGQHHLDTHLPERDMLVQQYFDSVVEPGERCLILIAGDFSHAVRKRSLFLGGRHAGPEGMPVRVAADEIDAARRVLELVPQCAGSVPLYARVDLLRDESGAPRLMELELVEPSLFLEEGPGSAARLVAGLEARMR